MERYINLKKKRLKQVKKPVFARRSVIDMPKMNLTHSTNSIKQPIAKINYDRPADIIRFRNKEVEHWLSLRILDFLNQAKTVSALTDVEDRYNNYSIGSTVAQRILDKRRQLPRKRFTRVEELENIDGFGEDKFNDLSLLLNQKADEFFKNSLFNELLLSKWEVVYHRIKVETEDEWTKLTQSSGWRQLWLTKQLGILSQQLTNEASSIRTRSYMRDAYIDEFGEEELASYAFALCWYRVDMDNWFSFDRMLSKVRSYLTYYKHPSYSLSLLLAKGFPMSALNVQGVSTPDLPIILNFAERSVTFWVIGLKD